MVTRCNVLHVGIQTRTFQVTTKAQGLSMARGLKGRRLGVVGDEIREVKGCWRSTGG